MLINPARRRRARRPVGLTMSAGNSVGRCTQACSPRRPVTSCYCSRFHSSELNANPTRFNTLRSTALDFIFLGALGTRILCSLVGRLRERIEALTVLQSAACDGSFRNVTRRIPIEPKLEASCSGTQDSRIGLAKQVSDFHDT